MDERSLGQRLQAARRSAGLTQQSLCHEAGLSYSTLTKIERGAIKAPSVFTIQHIAAAVGISLDDLLGNQPLPALASRPPARTYAVSTGGVRFVYFDINGCLVRFFQQAFTRLSADSGVPSDIVEAAFWHYNDDVCRGKLSLEAFNQAYAKRLGLPTLDWQSYYLDAIEPVSEVRALVTWVAERYRIGLLTNIMPGFIDAMKARDLLPDIAYDAIIDSSVVGAIKPEARMYQIAAERSGCQPNEILLVDDERPNLMAAERSGWHVLWLDDYRLQASVERIRSVLEPADT